LAEIWDALRAAAEADLNLAQTFLDSAGVIIASADMTTCYDERGLGKCDFFPFLFCSHIRKHSCALIVNSIAGAKYELPKYVLSEPTNLIRDS